MAIGSQEWIEQSLARLEQLEQQREKHEKALETAIDGEALRENSEAIDKLDEEIKSLYEALEAVAEEEDEAPAQDDDSVQAAVTNQFSREQDAEIGDSQSTPAAVPVADPPLGSPFGGAPASPAAASSGDDLGSPFGGAPAPVEAAPAINPDFAATYAGDDDIKVKGGAGKWILIGLVLVGAAGGGGYYFYNQQKKNEPPPPVEKGPVKVIEAGEVPPDSEGPQGAKGADVDATPIEDLKAGKKKSGGGGHKNTGGGGGKKVQKKTKRTDEVDLSNGNDPLG